MSLHQYPNHPPIVCQRLCVPLFVALLCLSCDFIKSTAPLHSPRSPKFLQSELLSLLNLAQNAQTAPQIQTKIAAYLPPALLVQSLLRETDQNKGLGLFYETQIRANALKELPWALKELASLGYNQVEIASVGPQSGSTNAFGDLALLEQLKERSGLYTVRIGKAGSEDQSLRLSAWLYFEERGWVSLLKLGEEIRKRQAP